jgi:hypothetical protein
MSAPTPPASVYAGEELASSKSRLLLPGRSSPWLTVWGARGVPGPTSYRALGTKRKPTSVPALRHATAVSFARVLRERRCGTS